MIYEVEQYELHAQRWRVEGTDEADAIAKVLMGEGDPHSLVFVEVVDQLGMSVLENLDLADDLLERRVITDTDNIIPSIRNVQKIKS